MQTQEQAKIAHLSLFDLAYMLKACPDEAYRRDMFALAEATANVLTDERLAIGDLRTRFASDGEQFKVTIGDLTAEGFAFARKGYQRWLANTDRWKDGRPLPKLEAALRKQVAAHRRASA
jgi:hypothetical protein